MERGEGGGGEEKGGVTNRTETLLSIMDGICPSVQVLIGGSTGKGELKIRGKGGRRGEEKGGVTNRTETLLSIINGICPSVQVLIGGSTGKGELEIRKEGKVIPRSLEEKIVIRILVGGGGGAQSGTSPSPSTFDTIHPIDMKLGTYNKSHLYFQLNETTWYLIGFHGNNSQIVCF